MSGMRKLMESVGWASGDYRDEEDDRYDQDGNWVDDYEDEEIEEARDPREVTNTLHQMMDEDLLDPRIIADAALAHMSEAEVASMVEDYDWYPSDDEDIDMDDYDIDMDDYMSPEEEEEFINTDHGSRGNPAEGLGEDPWGIGEGDVDISAEEPVQAEQGRSDWENVDTDSISIEGVDTRDYPDFVDAFSAEGYWNDGTEMTEDELYRFDMDTDYASINAYETLL